MLAAAMTSWQAVWHQHMQQHSVGWGGARLDDAAVQRQQKYAASASASASAQTLCWSTLSDEAVQAEEQAVRGSSERGKDGE